MKITKFTHACVRLDNGGVLVIDPGVWSEHTALRDVDAVLVSHAHGDHVDVLRLIALAHRGVPIFGPAGGGFPEELPITPVAVDEEFTAAGFTVRGVGGRHATIYDGRPDLANLGYVVDTGEGNLYHPGDALHVPEQPVDTLLIPAQAMWLKGGAQAIAFAEAIGPRRSFPIHEGQLNDRGLASVNAWYGGEIGDGYRYLAPGENL